MKKIDRRKGKSVVKGSRIDPEQNTHVKLSLQEAYEVFLSAKKSEGLRDRTLKDYATNWRYFLSWLLEEEHISTINEVTPTILRNYINYMADKKRYSEVEERQKSGETLSPHTISIRYRALRTMFNFLAAEGLITTNPVASIKLPRFDRVEKETFTDDQVRMLIQAPDRSTLAGFRDRALMMALADGGFRINEALGLKTEHLDIRARCVHLPGYMNKNRRPRIVPLSAETVRELLALINENSRFFDSEYIFLSNYGEPLQADNFRKRLKDYARSCGVPVELAHPHQFRSYFCTSYLLNGGDLFSLQRIVAHSNIETTRGYAKMNNQNLKDQHSQFSPLSKLKNFRVNKLR